METLENLKIWDDALVYDKNVLFEAILYVQRMTNNYLIIGGAKFNKTHGWMCRNHNMFEKRATEEDIERVEKKKKKKHISDIMC